MVVRGIDGRPVQGGTAHYVDVVPDDPCVDAEGAKRRRDGGETVGFLQAQTACIGQMRRSRGSGCDGGKRGHEVRDIRDVDVRAM